MKKDYLTKSARETKDLAKKIAKKILKREGPIILALFGELGAGKTTFLKGFAQSLGIKEGLQSPTFVIIKRYKVPKKNFKDFYHIDCYRIKNQKDIQNLGVERILKEKGNIVAIEWPEKIREVLPKDIIQIKFQIKDKKIRKIILKE